MDHLRLPLKFAIAVLYLSLAACGSTITSTPNTPTVPIPTQSSEYSITATDMGNGAEVPAGASTSFALSLHYPAAHPPKTVVWSTENVPTGITAEIVGGASPFQRRLIITSDSTTAAGSYTVEVTATIDTNHVDKTAIKAEVAACAETVSGSSTKDINSNLVGLITAGKPAVEHGLLVPVQICAPKHLTVKLTNAKADDGSIMSIPPAFYIFRSQVWPAPTNITAHGLDELLNVQTPSVGQANGNQLEADLPSGLYLLIFEHDRFGVTLTPQSTPASITYDLKIG